MSSNTETFTFDRPETIDDATFSRIVFIRPLEIAAQPIIDHNLELIDTVRRLRPWYRGEHDGTGPELLSTLLDPEYVGREVRFTVRGRCGDPDAGTQEKSISAVLDAAETPPVPPTPTGPTVTVTQTARWRAD